MRKFINKILDVPKLIRTIWIMLWVILIILLVFKFCFNLWYPIVIENEAFINICNFIDNHEWLSKTIMLLFYIINLNLLSLINMGKEKYSNILELIIINIIIVSVFFIKLLNTILGNVLEILFLFVAFSFVNIKQRNYKNKIIDILIPLIMYAVINIWQLSIYLVRGLDLNALDSMPNLIPYILQFDYYIFLIITWIGVSFMGLFGAGWLWSKDITVLKAHKEKELAKEKPDMKLVEKIDSRIAELEKEGK